MGPESKIKTKTKTQLSWILPGPKQKLEHELNAGRSVDWCRSYPQEADSAGVRQDRGRKRKQADVAKC